MHWNGKALEEARKAAGFRSQEALAEAIGVTRQSVNQWERGTEPRGASLVALCKVLDMPVESFFTPEKLAV